MLFEEVWGVQRGVRCYVRERSGSIRKAVHAESNRVTTASCVPNTTQNKSTLQQHLGRCWQLSRADTRYLHLRMYHWKKGSTKVHEWVRCSQIHEFTGPVGATTAALVARNNQATPPAP